jgi:hypothetical protein
VLRIAKSAIVLAYLPVSIITENWFPPRVILVVYWIFDESFRPVEPVIEALLCSRLASECVCLPWIPTRAASTRSMGSEAKQQRSEINDVLIMCVDDAHCVQDRDEETRE